MWIVLDPETDVVVAGPFATTEDAQAFVATSTDENKGRWVIAPHEAD